MGDFIHGWQHHSAVPHVCEETTLLFTKLAIALSEKNIADLVLIMFDLTEFLKLIAIGKNLSNCQLKKLLNIYIRLLAFIGIFLKIVRSIRGFVHCDKINDFNEEVLSYDCITNSLIYTNTSRSAQRDVRNDFELKTCRLKEEYLHTEFS